MCDHILGPISPIDGKRLCLFCKEKVSSEGTFNIENIAGTMEVYPAGIFSQWTGDQIRRFLKVRKGDLLLHNWHANNIYLFRRSNDNE